MAAVPPHSCCSTEHSSDLELGAFEAENNSKLEGLLVIVFIHFLFSEHFYLCTNLTTCLCLKQETVLFLGAGGAVTGGADRLCVGDQLGTLDE